MLRRLYEEHGRYFDSFVWFGFEFYVGFDLVSSQDLPFFFSLSPFPVVLDLRIRGLSGGKMALRLRDLSRPDPVLGLRAGMFDTVEPV